MNDQIAKIFNETARLQEVKGESSFRIHANRKVARILANFPTDISLLYKEKGLKGLTEIEGIGLSSAKKIEDYLKRGKMSTFDKLQEETAIQDLITHFFSSKGVGLQELKENAKKRKIIYSRFTKPAKQLLELAGDSETAKKAIVTVAAWATSRKLDYTIETVFKKWLELDKLKPKEKVKKPFYLGDPMVFQEARKKWFVIKNGQWLEYVDKESKIEWRIID